MGGDGFVHHKHPHSNLSLVWPQVAGDPIHEVFIGSCMTNIGHFRAAGKLLAQFPGQLPTRLWVAPPTKMDAAQLTEEGYYATYGKVPCPLRTSVSTTRHRGSTRHSTPSSRHLDGKAPHRSTRKCRVSVALPLDTRVGEPLAPCHSDTHVLGQCRPHSTCAACHWRTVPLFDAAPRCLWVGDGWLTDHRRLTSGDGRVD